MRKNVTNSQENELKFREHLRGLVPKIFAELNSRLDGGPQPEIMPNLSEKDRGIAERFVALQNEHGALYRKDMQKTDHYRMQSLMRKYNCTYLEVVKLFVKNVRYMSPELAEVVGYADLVEDALEVYGKVYKNFGHLPMNGLSKKSYVFLEGKYAGISMAKRLQIVLETFAPELGEVNVKSMDFVAVPRPSHYVSEADFLAWGEKIKNLCADINGNIDKIFSPELSGEFKKLLGALALNHLSFDEFVKRYTGCWYTKCYIADADKATRHMVVNYHDKYGTYRGIHDNDPYLGSKVNTIEKGKKLCSMIELLESWGLESDNKEPVNSLTADDLKQMEDKLIQLLKSICLDGNVLPKNIWGINKDTKLALYRATVLKNKYNFDSVRDYVSSLGFVYNPDTFGNFKSKTCLTQRDIQFYNFWSDDASEYDIESVMEDMDIEFAAVEGHFKSYRQLVFNKMDSSRVAQKGIKQMH